MFKLCRKCGSDNNGQAKRKAFEAQGKFWCGHCGTKLERQ